LVNSAFFGLTQSVSTVRTAVSYLGLDVLKQLVLSAEIFRTFQPRKRIRGFSFEELQEHSRLSAIIAARLPAPKHIVSAGVVAALLHDAGKLVLAVRLPEQFERALMKAAQEGRPLYTVEEELTRAGHAEVGAYLLALWGLPLPIVDAVCRHHHPARAGDTPPGLDVLAITHVADALACELAPAPPDGSAKPQRAGCSPLNLEYLAEFGVADRLPDWRAMAAEIAHPPGAPQCRMR